MIGVLVKMIIHGILACLIVNAIKHVKLMNIWILKKNCVKKHLFGMSVLACENEILNTTENSLDYQNVTCEKTVA